MARNWLRIDCVTFLTSLLAGLLPVGVLSVISYLSLETLRAPLYDIVLREHVDYLQSRTERIDVEFRERLERLKRELAGCIEGKPPPQRRKNRAEQTQQSCAQRGDKGAVATVHLYHSGE